MLRSITSFCVCMQVHIHVHTNLLPFLSRLPCNHCCCRCLCLYITWLYYLITYYAPPELMHSTTHLSHWNDVTVAATSQQRCCCLIVIVIVMIAVAVSLQYKVYSIRSALCAPLTTLTTLTAHNSVVMLMDMNVHAYVLHDARRHGLCKLFFCCCCCVFFVCSFIYDEVCLFNDILVYFQWMRWWCWRGWWRWWQKIRVKWSAKKEENIDKK